DRAAASLALVRGFVDRHEIPEDADGSLVTSFFASGRAAFAISGPWLANDLGGAGKVHYRVVPLPRVRATGEKMRPLLTVEAVMLSPQGAKRDDAIALAKLLGSAEAARIRAEKARALTPRSDVPVPEGDAF